MQTRLQGSGSVPAAHPRRAGDPRHDRRRVLPPASAPIGRPAARWLRKLRAGRRAAVIVLWTLLSLAIQGVLILLPGRPKVVFPLIFWRLFNWMLGMEVRVIGTPANRSVTGRPVVFAANHSSWLDIAVIGARIEACFVSKDDVQDWPGVNLVARLGRTFYVSRQRSSTGRESDKMRARLDEGDDLVLFPEGTTDDGVRVLPFRSSFLSVAEGNNPPLVQPVSIVYDRLLGLPAGRFNRPLFAYYGNMAIGAHFWRLVQCLGFRATLLVHPPVDPRSYADRKELAKALHDIVEKGAAALRQNRQVVLASIVPADV